MEKDRQEEARKRNWTIRRLRGVYYLFMSLDCMEGARITDKALADLGAEPQGARDLREGEELLRELTRA